MTRRYVCGKKFKLSLETRKKGEKQKPRWFSDPLNLDIMQTLLGDVVVIPIKERSTDYVRSLENSIRQHYYRVEKMSVHIEKTPEHMTIWIRTRKEKEVKPVIREKTKNKKVFKSPTYYHKGA